METKLLNNESVDTIHSAFVEAFSDYAVNIAMTKEKFQDFIRCRDINKDYSVGLYEKGLVGFILNGYRIIDGQRYCYDGGTGFLPTYRNQGLGSKLLQQMIMMLRERGIQHYVLEVLEDNIPAQKLYEKYGFHISRHLLCYKAQRKAMAELNLVDKNFRLNEIDGNQLANYITWWDYTPTWQNATPSILNDPNYRSFELLRENEVVGYGVIHSTAGDIPQFAIKREFRGKGFGKILFKMLAESTYAEELRLINVEDKPEFAAALEKIGFAPFVNQFEMQFSFEN
ncbi:MAG TPA: GNAT family N-acetyltransferase [Williamwhitmania sp.]|nr:GNAT family N-acetyltransferase [Williamwhitmania sp.]